MRLVASGLCGVISHFLILEFDFRVHIAHCTLPLCVYGLYIHVCIEMVNAKVVTVRVYVWLMGRYGCGRNRSHGGKINSLHYP